jgi:hypothetical protein
MRFRHIGRLALLAPLLLPAPPAEAQTRKMFAGAGVIADNDRTNSALTESVATSWTLVFGADVIPHVGIRVVFDTPREVSSIAEGTYTRPPSHPVHEHLTRTRRSMTYGALGDIHGQVAPNVRLAVTYGLLNVTHDSETVIVRDELRPDGSRAPLPDLRDEGDYDWIGLAFGVEAGILLAGRVEIVPEVRVISFVPSDSPSPYIVRAGVGMRWRF